MKMLKRRLAIVVILIMVLSSVSSEITFAAEENRVISSEKKAAEDIEISQYNGEKAEESLSEEEMIEETGDSGSESAEVKEIETLQENPEETLETKEEVDFEQHLNYVYVESPYLETPGRQNIVVSWGNGTEDIDDMRIVLKNSKGNMEEWVSTKHVDNVYLFTKEYIENEKMNMK